MKLKYIIPALLFALPLVGCGSTNPINGEDTPLPSTPGPEGFMEYSVNFQTFDLGGQTLFQSSDPTFDSTVLSYIQTQTDLVTSFDADDGNRVRIKVDTFDGDYGSVQGLIIGSQENDGYVTMNFSKELAYVKVKAQQYYNIQTRYYEESEYLDPNYDSGTDYVADDSEDGYHFEGHFSLIVGDEIWIGPGEGYEFDKENEWNPIVKIPEIVEKKFDINKNTLRIEGFKSERARIYEMTFGFAL